MEAANLGGDQVGVLAAEVDDRDPVVIHKRLVYLIGSQEAGLKPGTTYVVLAFRPARRRT